MMWACTNSLLRSPQIISTCIQGEAALRASTEQAAAAIAAGQMTFIAGLLALAAALIGTMAGFWELEAKRSLPNHFRKRHKITQPGKKFICSRGQVLPQG
jgi:hypothetical protein